MKSLSINDLRDICAEAWAVPSTSIALLLNPRTTTVTSTCDTEVRILVDTEHKIGPNPARLIVEAALREIEESAAKRARELLNARLAVAQSQSRAERAQNLRARLREMLGLPAAAPTAVVAPGVMTVDLAEVQRVTAEAVVRGREASAALLEDLADQLEISAGQGDVEATQYSELCERARIFRDAAKAIRTEVSRG